MAGPHYWALNDFHLTIILIETYLYPKQMRQFFRWESEGIIDSFNSLLFKAIDFSFDECKSQLLSFYLRVGSDVAFRRWPPFLHKTADI